MANKFELERNLVILSLPTISKLFSYERIGSDALNLYVFYYWNAKRQKTNQPKATPKYCQKGLHWGKERFLKADKLLRELRLIEKIPAKDNKGRIMGWYVKLNYIWATQKEREINPETLETRRLENPPSGKQTINALSVNNINALSVNNKDIETFWTYFLLKTKKKFKLTNDKRELIKKRLKEGYTLDDLKKAVDNFVKDPWEGRADHLDLIYCIGKQRGKPDNLEKWLNIAEKAFLRRPNKRPAIIVAAELKAQRYTKEEIKTEMIGEYTEAEVGKALEQLF